jgi:TolB-like protein
MWMAVNLGDIVVEDDNLHGDGINIAARLESLAEPDAILVSEEVARLVDGKVSAAVEFVEERTVKNIERPVRIWRIDPFAAPQDKAKATVTRPRNRRWLYALPIVGVLAAVVGGLLWYQPWTPRVEAARVERMAFPLPDKPSIAVLPFDNLSGNAAQEYFSDGISEDIITDLSQLSNLIVIARNSSFSYKSQNVNFQEVGRDLGAKFVLEGSVRKAGNRVRISAHLVDTANGHHLWAERYDRKLDDIFSLQDEITQLIVSRLSVRLVEGEENRLIRRETDSFEAYDIFLQGQRHLNTFTPESFALARSALRDAIALDPEFARAYGAFAVTLAREILLGWSTSPTEALIRALDVAQSAVAIDPESPQVLWALGYVHLYRKEHLQAFEIVNRAIELAPNYADGYGLLANISNFTGQAANAVRYIEKGIELNPHYSWDYPYELGRAQYQLGDYEAAVANLSEALERNAFSSVPRLYLAASYIRLGRPDDAEWQVLQLGVNNPEMTE